MTHKEAKEFLENRINPNMVGTVLRAAEEEGEKHALPSGGEVGDVLKKTTDGAEWAEETKELPSGGSVGDILTKTGGGTEWKPNQQDLIITVTKNGNNWTWDKTEEEIVAAGENSIVHLIETGGIKHFLRQTYFSLDNTASLPEEIVWQIKHYDQNMTAGYDKDEVYYDKFYVRGPWD